MGMSEFYGPRDDAESIRVMHRSIELGIDFFDTADVYGNGENEKLVGNAIRDRRDKVFLATKFANIRDAGGKFVGISGIDLYYQHRVDPNTPIEETVGAMAELVKAGKVRHLGLSEASPATMRRAAKVHPIAALQTEYSLWSRDPESEILPTCRELGVTFVAYSPLGRGFLTGQFKSPDDLPADDWRRMNPRFQGENFNKNLELVKQIEALASAKGVKPSQLALAWTLAKGDEIVPIPGTKRIKYLEENAAAVRILLTREELAQLDAILPLGAAAGTRYPEAGMAAVNR
jgi:aryl-alcohol dehydrogenase-like predicted oxidoreductase